MGRGQGDAWSRGRTLTSEKFFVGTDRADTDLLVDDVHSAEAGEMGPGELSVPPSLISTGSLDRMWHWSPGVLAPQPPG